MRRRPTFPPPRPRRGGGQGEGADCSHDGYDEIKQMPNGYSGTCSVGGNWQTSNSDASIRWGHTLWTFAALNND